MHKGINCLTTDIILTLALTLVNRGILGKIMKSHYYFEGTEIIKFWLLLLRVKREANSSGI